LDACLELNDANLRVLVKRDDGNTESVWQPSQAIGLVLVIEGVKDLDCEVALVRLESFVVLNMLASHWTTRYIACVVVVVGSGRRRRLLHGTTLHGHGGWSRHGCLRVGRRQAGRVMEQTVWVEGTL
jgi:hypothetical protein